MRSYSEAAVEQTTQLGEEIHPRRTSRQVEVDERPRGGQRMEVRDKARAANVIERDVDTVNQ